jgi:hypothetical protein
MQNIITGDMRKRKKAGWNIKKNITKETGKE